MRLRTLFFGLILFAVACGDDGPVNTGSNASNSNTGTDAGVDAGDLGPLPSTAYRRTLDELPPGTEIVSEEELRQGIEAGELMPVSIGSVEDAEEAAAEQEAMDDAFIAQWEADHPGRKLLTEDAEDPGSMSLPGGNTLITVPMADGTMRQFEQPGDRWLKRSVVETIETFPKRDNQVRIYSELYANIPPQYKDILGLVAPDLLVDTQEYPDDTVAGFNDAILGRMEEFVVFETAPNIPDGYVANCDLEEGAGEGSDRNGNDYSDPACQHDPNELWANIDFPMKWYATCVKDQANRGTCTAFGSVALLEIWVAKLENRWVNLSEQAFYRKSKFDWEFPRRDVSDGHYYSPIFYFMEETGWGVPFEDYWNYNPSLNRIRDFVYVDAAWYEHSCDDYDERCSDSSHQTTMVCAEVGGNVECGFGWIPPPIGTPRVELSSYATIWDHDDPEQSVDLMRIALWMGFPVALGYKCGWGCGHAVAVVGFVDNEDLADAMPGYAPGDGGGYFIIKNSYSNCYGDGGYDYFTYDYVAERATSAFAIHGITMAGTP